jgi:hypothetical protein
VTRRLLTALAAVALLAGCPIPQPLPDYPAGTITPPRILTESVTVVRESDQALMPDGVIFVPANCTSTLPGPGYTIGARLTDPNNIEQVEARWFVNYQATQIPSHNARSEETLQGPVDATVFERTVTPWTFHPYDYPPPVDGVTPATPCAGPEPGRYCGAGTIRMVELVVSNNFAPDDTGALPFRSPAKKFETQQQRWTFLFVNSPDPATDPACPQP